MREVFRTPHGVTVSYSRYGSGPPLVLVHGSFSDDLSNWEFVKPLWEKQFTVYAIARRGRGGTDATAGHSLEDESQDVVDLIGAIGEPVYLLGHSYGAHCGLLAAAKVPESIRKLILYEPIGPHVLSSQVLAPLARLAQAGDWDGFAFAFFRDALTVPLPELEAVKASEQLWAPILADARASWHDLSAVNRYKFDAERFRSVHIPILLQVGSESPRHLYVTDALAAVLPDARIEELPGQAHEGMTTAPGMYSDSVTRFLLGRS